MSALFEPIRIGPLHLKNRVVMSPMQQYRGTVQSYANDYHVEFYSRRARGGIGLLIVETAPVAENGRFYFDDSGIYSPFHVEPLARVVRAVHAENVPIVLQVGHAGRKSAPGDGRQLIGPSPVAYDDAHGIPQAMQHHDIKAAIESFADAARRTIAAGFDGIEIHAAHGYLIHQFLSPLSNQRTDEYGGSVENRARFLKEIFQATRAVVGPTFPILVRVSASDYHLEGLDVDMVIDSLRYLLPYGLDAIDVSSGGLTPEKPPGIGPNYQVPFAEKIKRSFPTIPVIAVGLIRGGAPSDEIISSGKADLIAYGRPLVEDPDYAFSLRADLEGSVSKVR